MNSLDIVEGCHGVTYRKLDHWCYKGVFGVERSTPPERGSRREFNATDLRVARVLGPISLIFDEWSNGKGGPIPLYCAIAEHVRQHVSPVEITLGTGVILTIDTEVVSAMGTP